VVGFGRRAAGWSHPSAEYREWDLIAGSAKPAGRVAGEAGVSRPDAVSLGGFDAVVHCAALADDWAPRELALRVNRDGTRAVIEAFPGARLVHLSTSSVYDARTPSVLLREGAVEGAHFLSNYSWSKALAEVEAARAGAVILRPHAVYGPGDTTLLPRILAGVRRGRLALPNGGRVLHSLTHIDNLVAAVLAGLDPQAPAGAYNVADDAPVLLSEVLAEFLERRGVAARLVDLPYRTAYALAGGLETAARVTGRRPRITRYAVSQLGLERTFDLTAARTHLNYRPTPTSLVGATTW
jgi:nucleoside-diphosphate-sugar epimerase